MANAGGASDSTVNVSSQFLISDLGAFYPDGSQLSFNIRLTNNTGAPIIIGNGLSGLVVSCVTVV